MKTLREVLNELEVIAKVSGKSKLTESAAQATVQYITKIKEAFGDMENGVEADEAPVADNKRWWIKQERKCHNFDDDNDKLFSNRSQA